MHRDRACGQDLVAVDHPAACVGEQRPVGVAVVRHARVGAELDDLGADDLRMERAAADVDVRRRRAGVDRVDRCAESS